MITKSNILILGGDSYVGNALSKHLRQFNCFNTVSTTRRTSKNPTKMYFDPHKSTELSRLDNLNCVIISFGLTNIAYCEKFPENAWTVNYKLTLEILKKLREKNIHTIYLSTSSVFEGRTTACHILSKKSPRSVYSKTKSAIEDKIIKNFQDTTSIVRLTKVVDRNWIMHKIWQQEYADEGRVRPFKNRYFFPTKMNIVCGKVEQIIKEKKNGLYHIQSSPKISYYDYCQINSETIGISSGAILPFRDNVIKRSQLITPSLIPNI